MFTPIFQDIFVNDIYFLIVISRGYFTVVFKVLYFLKKLFFLFNFHIYSYISHDL